MVATVENALVLQIDDDRPGHRKRMGKPLKNGKPRFVWERVLHPNARAHWRTKNEVMKKDKEQVLFAVLQSGCAFYPFERAHVEVTLFVKPVARRDDDNLAYTIKGVLDGLVDAGVIVDDSAAVIGHVDITVVEDASRAYRYEVRVVTA